MLGSHFYNLADMKKQIHITMQLVSAIMALLVAMPSHLMAEGVSAAVPPIVITEMQPGTATSGSQEFVELFNQSTQAIDLTKGQWQVQITSSKATTWDGAKTVNLSGVFYPGTYMLLASNYTATGDSKSYLQDYASAQFTAGLTATSGHIRVVYTSSGSTLSSDKLEWSTTQADGSYTSAGISGTSTYALDAAISTGSSIKRTTDINHVFMNTTDISQNFAVSPCPSPTATNTASQSSITDTSSAPLPTSIDITNPLCLVTAPSATGEDDELATSNTEPPAVLLPSEVSPTVASTASAPSIPASDKGLDAPQITELLPNPGSPHTDAADEFVELYNPNAVAFDLSGFMLEAGLTGNKHFTFPAGTTIAPHAFVAYFSETTKLSLSNSGGKVTLLDPLERVISQSDAYGTAKDNQAWARANGAWYWTTQPTPNAQNVISQPAAKTKSTSASTASKTKKSSAASAASAKKSTTASDTQLASNTVEDTPLHPLTLAVVGGFALLYGAYEYRHDVANKLYQLRRYREARREARSQLKGR
jgi:hypothetical protein